MAKANFSAKSLQTLVKNSVFNASTWKPVGDPMTLKELWDITNPGLYEKIDGNKAEVTSTEFESGDVALRIQVPFKDGSSLELKVSGKTELEEGDTVKIDSITAQILEKAGQDNILRYDAEVA